jgi:hypothetical protein
MFIVDINIPLCMQQEEGNDLCEWLQTCIQKVFHMCYEEMFQIS